MSRGRTRTGGRDIGFPFSEHRVHSLSFMRAPKARYPIINLASTFNYAVKTADRSLSAGQDASSRLSRHSLYSERDSRARAWPHVQSSYSSTGSLFFILRLVTIRGVLRAGLIECALVCAWKRRWMGVDCVRGCCAWSLHQIAEFAVLVF